MLALNLVIFLTVQLAHKCVHIYALIFASGIQALKTSLATGVGLKSHFMTSS
jgi:hypothetical protein